MKLNQHIYDLLEEIHTDEELEVRPSEETIEQAKWIVDWFTLNNRPVYHCTPGPNHEIMIALRDSRELEIIVYPDKLKYVKLDIGPDKKASQGDFEFGNHADMSELLLWINRYR